MDDFSEFEAQLKQRLADLEERSQEIEDDLREPLDADLSEQANEIEDDDPLGGIDNVLRAEMEQIRRALSRIDDGSYGFCSVCGEEIGAERLKARPIATRCIKHAT